MHGAYIMVNKTGLFSAGGSHNLSKYFSESRGVTMLKKTEGGKYSSWRHCKQENLGVFRVTGEGLEFSS